MAADERIEIEIGLDNGSIKKAFINLEDASKALGKNIGKNVETGFTSSITGLTSGLKGKILALAGGLTLGVAFKKSIDLASEAESSIQGFNQSLANIGKFSEGASKDFLSFAESLNTALDTDDILKASQSLISVGGLSGDALKSATKASVDFSKALNIDLGTSFDLVAKAAAGNTSALSRYGIILDKNIPQGQKFQAVLDKINERFGGAATAQLNTFSGAMELLGNNFGDIFQALGDTIVKSPTVIKFIRGLAEAFGNLSKKLFEFAETGAVDRFFKKIIEIGSGIIDFLIDPLDRFYKFGEFVFNALKTGAQTLLFVFVGVGAGMIEFLSDFGVVSNDVAKNAKIMLESVGDNLVKFSGETRQSFDALFQQSEYVATARKSIKQYSQELINATAQNQIFTNSTIATKEAIVVQWKDIVAGFNEISQETVITAKQVAQAIRTSFINGVSNGLAAFGKGLATGKDGLKEFGKTVLNTLGSLAIQLGQFFILIGAGMSATSGLLGLQGGNAIAAGIALTILGGVLQGMAGGGGETGVTGGGVGGGFEGGGGAAFEAPTLEAPAEKQQVVVNVQGNILDRKESGLEIARVLEEHFSTSAGAAQFGAV